MFIIKIKNNFCCWLLCNIALYKLPLLSFSSYFFLWLISNPKQKKKFIRQSKNSFDKIIKIKTIIIHNSYNCCKCQLFIINIIVATFFFELKLVCSIFVLIKRSSFFCNFCVCVSDLYIRKYKLRKYTPIWITHSRFNQRFYFLIFLNS